MYFVLTAASSNPLYEYSTIYLFITLSVGILVIKENILPLIVQFFYI